jgi:glycopeptide antibiotics resistance protein
MRLSRLTIFFGLFIVISASFMRQALEQLYFHIGKHLTTTIFGIFCILAFLMIMLRLAKSPINIPRKILFFLILLAGFYFSWQLKILAERIHILEYGFLGYLASRDLWKKSSIVKTVIFLFLTVAIFAFLDEGFQYLLPYRVCDIRDVIFNLTGGLWGAGLFLIKNQSKLRTA